MSAAVHLAAPIERKHANLPRYVAVPASKVAPWALQTTTVVEGTLNGVDLGRRGLKKWDDQRWFIEIPEPLCRRANVETGHRVNLTLRLASERLPEELEQILASDPAAKEIWHSLNASGQRMLREHVGAARQPATRARRAAQALCRPAASHEP